MAFLAGLAAGYAAARLAAKLRREGVIRLRPLRLEDEDATRTYGE